MGTLAAVHPRVPEGLAVPLILDASFVSKSGPRDLGDRLVLARHGARCALEAGRYAAGRPWMRTRLSPLPPVADQTRGTDLDRETAVEVRLSLMQEALTAGAGSLLRARWVAVDGGYSSCSSWRECGNWICTR